MDICLLCRKVINDNTVSLHDTIDKIAIKDVLYDLNYKFPLEKCIGEKICFECCINLVGLYNFRENCCGLFTVEENENCCKICFGLPDIQLSLNLVFINEQSFNISNILMELCSYSINNEYNENLCRDCYENIVKNYSFHILCQKAVRFWTARVLHFSKSRLKKKRQTSSKFQNKKKIYKCTVCFKRFSSSYGLYEHSKLHSIERQFLCEVCSKIFSTHFSLKQHLKTHSGEKPYKCEFCTKSFAYKQSLNDHITIHTGERPYMCEICSKSFNRHDTLKKHLKLHNNQEKPFKCKICLKSFLRSENLKVHLRTHTGEKPYICEVCSKTFTQKVSLKHHFKIHTGEKPFKCEVCSKSFSRKDKLKEHMRTHTGERPYKCEMCSESFTFGIYLKRHLETHMLYYNT